MKIASSLTFTLIAQSVVLISNLIIFLITSRLLSDHELTVSALYTLYLLLGYGFLNLGYDNFFISKKVKDGHVFSIAFNLCIIVLLFVFIAVFIVFLFVDFDKYIFYLLFLSFSTSLLHVGNEFYRIKHSVLLEYKILAKINALSTSIRCIGIVFFAYIGLGLFAIPLGFLLYELFFIISFVNNSRLNIQIVSFSDLKLYLSSFRKYKTNLYIVFSRTISNFTHSIDRYFFSFQYNSNVFAGYTRIHQLASIPDANVRNPITSVIISFLANYPQKAGEIFIIFICVLISFCFIPLVIFSIYANDVINILIGSRWVKYSDLSFWLAIWGGGKLFFGIGVVYYLSMLKARQWLLINCLALVYYFFIFLLIYFFDIGFNLSVSIYCILSCAYWFVFGLLPVNNLIFKSNGLIVRYFKLLLFLLFIVFIYLFISIVNFQFTTVISMYLLSILSLLIFTYLARGKLKSVIYE